MIKAIKSFWEVHINLRYQLLVFPRLDYVRDEISECQFGEVYWVEPILWTYRILLSVRNLDR